MAKKPAKKRNVGFGAYTRAVLALEQPRPLSPAQKRRQDKAKAQQEFSELVLLFEDIKVELKENLAKGRFHYRNSLERIYRLVWGWESEGDLEGNLTAIARLRGVPLRAKANRFSGVVAICCERDRKTVSRWSQQLDDAFERVENTRSGVIESKNAASPAIELNVFDRDGVTAADTSTQLQNFGIIKGPSVAIEGGAGKETVVNHGQIVGNVMLGGGDDTFVFGKDGRVSGDVYLGAGNDHVVVENGSGVSHIADISGSDTVDVSAFFSNSVSSRAIPSSMEVTLS